MTNTTLQQLVAASAMITTLEHIAASGRLSIEQEKRVRRLVVQAARAFGFNTLAERPSSNVIDLEEATLELVRQQMGQS